MSTKEEKKATPNEVAIVNITDQVLAKVKVFQENNELSIPKDYSPENALKSAWLILQETKNNNNQYALTFCTKESIANSLLKMVVWGLSPLKKQCNFIMYGNVLSCNPEYTGNIALAKRYGGLKRIKANAIMKGDVFKFEIDAGTGYRRIIEHTQTLDSIGSKDVIGAYAIIELVDGSTDVEIMNMVQIRDAWNQGQMKGASPAHKNFPDQMAIKTVINRACKLLIRSSDDSALYDETDGEEKDSTAIAVKSEIREKANVIAMDFDEAEVVTEEEPKQEKMPVTSREKLAEMEAEIPKLKDKKSTVVQPNLDF